MKVVFLKWELLIDFSKYLQIERRNFQRERLEFFWMLSPLLKTDAGVDSSEQLSQDEIYCH